MKIFTDNQVDDATVSCDDADISYPASNVQDSRLSRIFRGDSDIGFDIKGSGGVQEVHQAYTNLVQDPNDLRAAGANWTLTNTTDEISTKSINGNLFTKVINAGANSGYNYQALTAAFTNLALTGQVILKKGSSAGNTTRFVIYNVTAAGTVFDILPDWDNFGSAPAVAADGILLDYTWYDSETLKLNFQCDVLANLTDDVQVRCYGSDNATDAEYTYWAEVQLVDDDEIIMFSFVEGIHAIDIISVTDTLGGKQTFDIVCEPKFLYTIADNKTIFSYRVDATHYMRLYYSESSHYFTFVWKDGIDLVSLHTQQFDDGTSYVNVNQRLRFILSLDTLSGTDTSRFICIPLESGAIAEDITFSAPPDVKTSTFPTISIGNMNDLEQAECLFEYVKKYAGLLVGTVTTSASADTLFEDKTLLLDTTYMERLTATDLIIANSTLRDGDVITLRANDVDSYGSGSPVDETVTWTKDITLHTFTKASYMYWRLAIASANVVDIGRIYLGESFTTPSISPLVGDFHKSHSKKITSRAGQSYMDGRYFAEKTAVKFRKVTHTEKADMIEQFETIDIGIPFFVTFNESVLDLGTIYVTWDGDGLNFNLLRNSSYYETNISLQEEVK